jgi:uncharacterized protein (TIGR02646 family)
MKRVLKGIEPTSFTQWKATANEEWEPSYPTLQNPQKRELHLRLLEEQGSLCCYCGREVDVNSSHIEHFRPQERYEHLALNYENLFASCIRETKPGNPLHCGHRKGSWFDEASHINPTDENCEQRFRYLFTGSIQRNDAQDFAAIEMIEVLDLDTPYLANRRKEVLRSFFDEKFVNDATADELLKIVNTLRARNVTEQTAFDHVIARYAEQLAEG